MICCIRSSLFYFLHWAASVRFCNRFLIAVLMYLFCYQKRNSLESNMYVVRIVRNERLKIEHFSQRLSLFLNFLAIDTLLRLVALHSHVGDSFRFLLFFFFLTLKSSFSRTSVVKDDCRSKTTSKLVKMTRNE